MSHIFPREFIAEPYVPLTPDEAREWEERWQIDLAEMRARVDAYLAAPRPPPMLPDDSWFDDSPADPMVDRFGHSETLSHSSAGSL